MIRGYKVHQMWTDLEPSPWVSRQAGARLSLHNAPEGQQVRQSMGHWAWAWNMDMGSGRGLAALETRRLHPSLPSLDRRHCKWSQDGKDAVCLIAVAEWQPVQRQERATACPSIKPPAWPSQLPGN